MSTRTARRRRFTAEDVRRILDGPLEIVIDDAVAYWLEDAGGQQLGPESIRSLAPLSLAIDLRAAGHDPDDLVLVVGLKTGERYELGSGVVLMGVAGLAARAPLIKAH